MEPLPCVICGANTKLFMAKRDFEILRCTDCRHLFTPPPSAGNHVASVYGDGYFFGGKDGYPNYLDEAALLEKRGQQYAKRLKSFCAPGTQLDIGAAAGFILKGFAAEGWSGTGLEPNAEMVRFGREQLDLDMVQGTLEDVQLEKQFDLVSMIQVVAHLTDLPAALGTLRKLTVDGGLLLIETWNQQSLTARLLGKYWHEYSPPSVLHWFTPEGLTELLRSYGFEPVARGRTLKWISLRHALALSGYAFGDRLSKAMQDKVPASWRIPYPSEDLFWAVYRAGG